jgi:hypothetical protein
MVNKHSEFRLYLKDPEGTWTSIFPVNSELKREKTNVILRQGFLVAEKFKLFWYPTSRKFHYWSICKPPEIRRQGDIYKYFQYGQICWHWASATCYSSNLFSRLSDVSAKGVSLYHHFFLTRYSLVVYNRRLFLSYTTLKRRLTQRLNGHLDRTASARPICQ